MYVALEHDCARKELGPPLIVGLGLRLVGEQLGGPAIDRGIEGVVRKRELNIQGVFVDLGNFGLHPATQMFALIGFDECVNLTAHLELLAPWLVSSSKFLELGIRNLEVVLVNGGFVVKKERH